MTTKAQREVFEVRRRESEEAHEAGAAYFQGHPEALLVEAWHEANRRYGYTARHQQMSFYLAVCAARAQRDEYNRERAGQ